MASSGSSKNNTSNAKKNHIKGGGRVDLSSELEDAIVDLLISRRNHKYPLLPAPAADQDDDNNNSNNNNDTDDNEGSDNDKDNGTSPSPTPPPSRRRFLKRLVTSHERHVLSLRLNQVSLMDDTTTTNSKHGASLSSYKSSSSSTFVSGGTTTCNTTPAAARPATGQKVRLDVVEAIYKSPDKWKVGSTKKTIVFDRSTTIPVLLKQVKDKIKMKKKPVRCFHVERNIELQLLHTVQGLRDGDVLYVTSQPAKEKQGQSTKDDTKSSQNNNKDDNDDMMMMMIMQVEDPLQLVKDVYAQRRRTAQGRRRRRRLILIPPIPLKQEMLATLPELHPPERNQLPAAAFRADILQALEQSRILILCGATGCGKSTQVPQYIWETLSRIHYSKKNESNDNNNENNYINIVVTQPRRVAAMALAERVAVEQSSSPPGTKGSLVGYQVRLDAAITDTTRITYMTVGILLRRLTAPSTTTITLSGDPENDDEMNHIPLSDVSHLIVDEVHERDMNTDFCLTILRRVLVQNPHLKIILMSATNTPDLFYHYFRSPKLGIEPKILQIPGRTFPVDTFWLTDIEKMLGKKLKQWTENCDGQTKGSASTTKGAENNGTLLLSPNASAAIDNSFISSLVLRLVQDHEASRPAILVFLPGRGEIESLARTLRTDDKETKSLSIHILHSAVSQKNQKAVFQPAEKGKIKIVLATNVAETSITIPDVSIVIDTGRVKESRFNSSTRIRELVTVWTSQSSATQRKGRAGRTRQGYCFRLYTETFAQHHMLERTTPEMLRTPLDELVLQSCLLEEDHKDQWKQKQKKQSLQTNSDTKSQTAPSPPEGTVPVVFLSKTPEPPPALSLLHACQHLIEVGALEHLSGADADMRVKLTPLGYHLSQLPMDVKIGKILIVGSILGCIEPALTVAATLSSTKSIFWSSNFRPQHKELIENGFGGATWPGGTVKGDSIASIAAYEAWSSSTHAHDYQRFLFAKEHGLDHNVLNDIYNLRQQFRDCMLDAGFLSTRHETGVYSENARLTSCCLVAGLYPNVATLMRPVRGKLGFRGGRLLTQDGTVCTPSSQSFQVERVRNVSESGRDVYAMYQSKNQIIGAQKDVGGGNTAAASPTPSKTKQQVFLNEVNFVSRFALLLFGGNLVVEDNFVVMDGWLKFKIGDNGRNSAIVMTELRRELDMVFLQELKSGGEDRVGGSKSGSSSSNCSRNAVIDMVVKLLEDE